jgi:hypothetical protein
MSVRVNDKLPFFKSRLYAVMDDALKEAARDGLIQARNYAPFDKGELMGQSVVRKLSVMKWRISFWIEYARFQEFGGDSKRRVRNYTTSGTGKAYLKRAGDEQSNKITNKFRKHAMRVKV